MYLSNIIIKVYFFSIFQSLSPHFFWYESSNNEKKRILKGTKLLHPVMKRYLEVPNKVSNMANRAELGKYPTIIDIDKKMARVLRYL